MFVEPWNVFQGRSSQATLSTTVGYTRFEKKLIIWDNDANGLRICRHFVMPPLVCLKIKSEKQVQKFHTDDTSLRRSGWCFWWVRENFSFSTIYLSLAKSLSLILEISTTYRLVSYLLADNWLICRLCAQCMISKSNVNSVLCDRVFVIIYFKTMYSI